MRIFVLDDSEERLRTFRSVLIGHTVITAKTVSEAISALDKDGPFEYIFLDHDLGDQIMVPSGPGTGYEVAQWLERHPEKQALHIILHSFNPDGRKAMASILPTAQESPGAWLYLKNKII